MSTNTGKGMGRRSFLAIAVGGSALAAPLAARLARWNPKPRMASRSTSAAVDPFFAHLTPGTRIDRWTIEAVHPVHMGAVPVVLSVGGRRFQVDVLKRDPELSSVADTHQLSVFVSNSGNGSTATREEDGLGAMALGRELLKLEAGGQPPSLLTLRERHRQFPSGVFQVLI